jgi:phosphate-selective porin OprO/OprP
MLSARHFALNAYLSYTGFKPFGGTLAIEGRHHGFALYPRRGDELTVHGARFIAGHGEHNGSRSFPVGARWFNDRFWVAAVAF